MKFRNTYINIKKWLLLLVVVAALQGCKKAVEVPAPSTSLIGSTVFADDKTAAAVLTGMYANMHSTNSFTDGNQGIADYMGSAADEFKNYYPGLTATEFYHNALISSNNYFWPQFFQYIYVANTALSGVGSSKSLSNGVKQQLLGEAKFMRAFMNFYAVNLYGDIPIVTSTDYAVNNVISRSPQTKVYEAIIADLLSAQQLLSADYRDEGNNTTDDRIRPNSVAATALLARAYLYAGDWKDAEIQATAVINNANYGLESDLNQVFLTNSNEAIWQLASANPVYTNTFDGYDFILNSTPGSSHRVALLPYIISAFENGDQRLVNWIGTYKSGVNTYYYPYKYKNHQSGSANTENLMVLRLAEQYLIRAEARAELGEANATDDLNAIRNRAGLNNYTGATDKASLLSAVLHERQVELFTEWGHRWLDLKRTGTLDAVMGGPNGVCAAKGGTWASTDALLPLPATEIKINPNLVQNPGYN